MVLLQYWGMKTTNISQLRTAATHLVRGLVEAPDQPVYVLRDSTVVAVLLSPAYWEAIQAEVRRLRARNRELFWDAVDDAEAQPSLPLELDSLFADLDLERSSAA